jgi:hypothetical protein
VLALPFGDPDVVAMSRADSGLRAQVEPLRRLGESEVARVLGVEPLTSVAWPPPGPLPAALDVVVGGQTRAVVLDSSALPPASGLAQPHTERPQPAAVGHRPGQRPGRRAGPVRAARAARHRPADRRGAGPRRRARLAEQRWIAETAIIAAETPSTSRTLLVAPAGSPTSTPEVARA